MSGSLLPGNTGPVVSTSTAPLSPAMAVAGMVPSTPPAEPGANPIARLLAACRRFAWLIVLISGLGTGATILAVRLIPKVYSVSTMLWIEQGSGRGGPIQAPGLLSDFSWDELLRTYTVLDPVVKQMKLYVIPGKGATRAMFDQFELAPRFLPGSYALTTDDAGASFTLKNSAGTMVDSGATTDSVGSKLGFIWVPGQGVLKPKSRIAFSVIAPRDASQDLMSSLGAKTSTEGTFLTITLTGGDPVRLAATMNALQKQFVDVAGDLKKQKLRELTLLLSEQQKQQETKLRAAEQALESFRVATITQPREDGPIVPGLQSTTSSAYGRYFQERVGLESIRQDRVAIEDVLARLPTGSVTVDAFVTIPSVRSAPDLSRVLGELSGALASLRALQAKYTDEYGPIKDLQSQIATMKTVTIPAFAAALVRQLKITEGDFEGRISKAGGDLKGIPVRAITEGRLQRDKDAAQVLFTNLQTRYEEAKLQEISAIPDVRIIDDAKPPSRPKNVGGFKLLFMGVAGSIGLAFGLAFLLDRVDRKFRYPEQASHELGLSILGAIPVVARERNGRPVPPDRLAQVVESFRSVRLNLAHMFESNSTICFTISSPSPGDGKSLIAANLALSFAQAGYRTLLIDGDTRRGELHRTFGTDRRPGLLDYLTTGGDVDKYLRPTTHPQLALLPCGTRHQDGPELLGSARMSELMALVKGRFEVVLVDSPPLGAGIDPFVLGTHCGSMLLVLRSGETDRQMAEAKLRIMDRLPVRMLGAVLNHIDANTGTYKYYSYSYGYAAEDEPEGDEVRSLTEGTASKV